jgi:hypothetical protein
MTVAGLATERQDDLIITRGASGASVRAIQRRCLAGELARLAPGIYVREQQPQAQAERVREHWIRILGELVPGSVVSHRSAYAAASAAAEGVLVLSHPTRFNRTIHLPGLRVALVKGPGALPGDTPLAEGALHQASTERMLLENLTRPRGPEGRSRGETAVMERLAQLLKAGGADALSQLRARARELVRPLEMGREFARLDGLIEFLLRPQPQAQAGDKPVRAVRDAPADAACIAMLRALAGRLKSEPLPRLVAPASEEPARSHLAFLEAYFDSRASGADLSIEQARAAVLRGQVTGAPSAELQELLGVFKLAVHSPLCDSVPPFGAWFAQGLKARHLLMMQLNAQAAPGRFRTDSGQNLANRFVDPDRIRSTLVAGSLLARGIPDGLARAIFYSVHLWRVHPFDHGSERLAHLLMNAELSSVGEARIIIAPRMRSRLEQARDRLVQGEDPDPYLQLVVALQRWSAALDYWDLDRLLAQVDRTHALERCGADAELVMPQDTTAP